MNIDASVLFQRLTSRELDVFYAVVRDALRNKDIAVRLAISVKTVETHRANINRKLYVHSTLQLFRFAAANKLVVF